MNELQLRDIITEDFQNEIQDSFAFATGFGVVFTDGEGKHIGPGENFCRFCSKINETDKGAQCCVLSNKHAIALALSTNRPSIYICHAGLVNIEIPLIYKGCCIGAITAGQVLCSEENLYPRDPAAEQVNWLTDPELASYYSEIKVMSRHQIEATATSLSNITNYIIQTLAYSQIQETLARKSAQLLQEENRRVHLEKQLKLAQLDALQKQVTPHFIFNVINSISRLLSLKEYSTAQQMLDSFSQMMRYSLHNIHSSVSLKQELEYIRNYLSIQKIRFADRIDYQISCDDRLENLPIPFFSLQPLVENSIEHGLLNKKDGGMLTLICARHESYDLIQISDNGIGIPRDMLQQFRTHSFLIPDGQGSHHVGLHNSYNRFLLVFGKRLHFEIDSTEGRSTTVSILIHH